MMFSQLALPRVGHLHKVLHIFSYLKAHTNYELVFDPSKNSSDKSDYPSQDWTYSIYHIEESELR